MPSRPRKRRALRPPRNSRLVVKGRSEDLRHDRFGIRALIEGCAAKASAGGGPNRAADSAPRTTVECPASPDGVRPWRHRAIPGNASCSASANSSAVSNRSSGSSASARANTCRSASRSPPASSVSRDARPAAPVADSRRPHSISCISAARLKTSARRSQAAPATRSGARVGPSHRRRHADALERARRRRGRSSAMSSVRDQHVARMQRAVVDVDDGREVERAGQLRGDTQRVGRPAPGPRRGRRRRASRPPRTPARDTPSADRCRSRSARRCRDAPARPRSAARTRRRADARARAEDRAGTALTATRRSRSGSYARNTGPKRPHRSDEEPETDRTHQAAQNRQLPCAVGTPLEGDVIVALKRWTLQCVNASSAE